MIIHIQREIGHKEEGHTTVDTDVEYDLAKDLFHEAIAEGMAPVGTPIGGGKEENVFGWNEVESYEKITFIPAYSGG